MATLDDDTPFLNAILWGPPGTGKTTAAAHMAKLGRVKYIRADQSVRAAPLRRLGIDTRLIEPVDTFDPTALENCINEWHEELGDETSGLAGVVLDTGTEWASKRAERQIDIDWKKYEVKSARDHTEVDPTLRFIAGDVRDQYNIVTQEGRRLGRRLRELPCHVVITFQVRRDVDQDSGRTVYGPDTNPALQGHLVAYADLVVQLIPEGSWPDGRPMVVGYSRPDGKHLRKDRDGLLPSRLADPTFDRLWAYASGALTKDSDEVQAAYRDIVKKRKEEDKL